MSHWKCVCVLSYSCVRTACLSWLLHWISHCRSFLCRFIFHACAFVFTLCFKNVTTLSCCNFGIHEPMLTFGRTVMAKVRPTTTHHSLFPGPPGWPGARRELLNFMVQGKVNRGRQRDHPDGRHSIWTNQCQPPPSPNFLQARCPSCHPTNSVKALKATSGFGLGRRC